MRIVKKNYSVKDIRKIFLKLKEDIEVLSEIDKVIVAREGLEPPIKSPTN